MSDLKISYLTLTYGRVKLLEETIQSFLNQDYDFNNIEMIILNDCPWQTLRYDHPRIKIINLPQTFRTFGEKESFGITQCSFDVIQQFDNDDIGLPNLSQQISKWFVDGSHLLHWKKGIFFVGKNIKQIRPVGNSGIVFSKEAVDLIGGYPKRNCGADMDFVVGIRKAGGKIIKAEPADKDLCWIYTWGKGGSYHLSGQGDDKNRPEEEQIIARHVRHMEKQRELGHEPEGIVQLNPGWIHDYPQMLKDYIKLNRNANN